jgi:GntR family transcriptional repressor for pyruvate dehydrogenase complex
VVSWPDQGGGIVPELDTFVRRSTSVSAEIVAHIETLISGGSLTAGTKLPSERELAQVLKVSRASLREAMHELQARHLVERTPGRGTVVSEAPGHARMAYDGLSAAERTLRDVADLRESIEPAFAQLAAERASEADLLALEQVLQRSSRNLSQEESLAADLQFHGLLAQASQNALMVTLNSLASSWTATVRSLSHERPASRRSSHDGHRRILDAVRNGNGAGARQAMLDHLVLIAALTRESHPAF